jgi:hypothetical protein
MHETMHWLPDAPSASDTFVVPGPDTIRVRTAFAVTSDAGSEGTPSGLGAGDLLGERD